MKSRKRDYSIEWKDGEYILIRFTSLQKIQLPINLQIGQRLDIINGVLYNPRFEEIIEDMYSLKCICKLNESFTDSPANIATYELKRNTQGGPILVRKTYRQNKRPK